MLWVCLSLAAAVLSFAWALAPLFKEAGEIPQGRGSEDLARAMDRSLMELETDLDLGKIQEEDLAAIKEHLRGELGV